MALFFSLLECLLLLVGIFWLLATRLSGLSCSLLAMLSFVIVLVLISYIYFLALVFHLSFWGLLIFMTMLNVLHVYRSIPWVIKLVDGYLGSGASVFWIPVVLGLTVLTYYFGNAVERWGAWDAWAIWNLHASFLYHPSFWTRLFTKALAYTHPDYPLMLPALIAFGWKSLGGIYPWLPALLAWVPLILIPLFVFVSLSRGKGRGYAFFAFAMVVFNSNFVSLSSEQLSDSWLALLILLSFILYQWIEIGPSHMAILIGFIGSSAGWIKNEGMLFYCLYALGFFFFQRSHRDRVVYFLIGSAIPLLVLLIFKLGYASDNYLFEARKGRGMLSLIMDVSRYGLILKSLFFSMLTNYGPLLLVMVLVVVYGSRFRSFGLLILGALLTCYMLVYLITPFDLHWHLVTSQDRLLLHLYPSTLYLCFDRLRALSFSDHQITTV